MAISVSERHVLPSNTAPFFIVGASRSGTTLLRLILTGHSRIHIPPETWFILSLVEQFPLTEVLTAGQVSLVIDAMASHDRWRDVGIEKHDILRWSKDLHEPRLADLISLVYLRQLDVVGKSRFGDKTPLYVGIVPELLTLYPDAKFIHLIRDGRDVAASFIDAGFGERCYDGENFEWIAAIRHTLRYRKSAFANCILEVRYEDLVANPAAAIEKICAFLGECFELSMMNYSDRTDMVPKRGEHIHTKLKNPILESSIASWKHKLSRFQCFVMEACMHRELRAMGYELRFGSFVWRVPLDITGLLSRAISPFLHRAIPALQRRKYLRQPFYL